jgi:hypothetical protein
MQRGTYKGWTDSQMEQALQAVVASGASIRRAALDYHVPKSSLGDRVSGRTVPGTKEWPTTISECNGSSLKVRIHRVRKVTQRSVVVGEQCLDSRRLWIMVGGRGFVDVTPICPSGVLLHCLW